jgi:hypothetical protein
VAVGKFRGQSVGRVGCGETECGFLCVSSYQRSEMQLLNFAERIKKQTGNRPCSCTVIVIITLREVTELHFHFYDSCNFTQDSIPFIACLSPTSQTT